MRLFSYCVLCVWLSATGLKAQVVDVSALPVCGQDCVAKQIGIAVSNARCNANEGSCYCTRGNFAQGVTDCARKGCSSSEVPPVIKYVTNYCFPEQGSSGANASSSSTFAADSATSSAITTSTSAPAPQSTSTSPTSVRTIFPSATRSPTSSGLSTSSKIGLGVGIGVVVPLGAIALAVMGSWYQRKRRAQAELDEITHSNTLSNTLSNDHSNTQSNRHTLSWTPSQRETSRAAEMLEAHRRSESRTTPVRGEFPMGEAGGQMLVGLPGSEVGYGRPL